MQDLPSVSMLQQHTMADEMCQARNSSLQGAPSTQLSSLPPPFAQAAALIAHWEAGDAQYVADNQEHVGGMSDGEQHMQPYEDFLLESPRYHDPHTFALHSTPGTDLGMETHMHIQHAATPDADPDDVSEASPVAQQAVDDDIEDTSSPAKEAPAASQRAALLQRARQDAGIAEQPPATDLTRHGASKRAGDDQAAVAAPSRAENARHPMDMHPMDMHHMHPMDMHPMDMHQVADQDTAAEHAGKMSTFPREASVEKGTCTAQGDAPAANGTQEVHTTDTTAEGDVHASDQQQAVHVIADVKVAAERCAEDSAREEVHALAPPPHIAPQPVAVASPAPDVTGARVRTLPCINIGMPKAATHQKLSTSTPPGPLDSAQLTDGPLLKRIKIGNRLAEPMNQEAQDLTAMPFDELVQWVHMLLLSHLSALGYSASHVNAGLSEELELWKAQAESRDGLTSPDQAALDQLHPYLHVRS
jgi:hypothetical protein